MVEVQTDRTKVTVNFTDENEIQSVILETINERGEDVTIRISHEPAVVLQNALMQAFDRTLITKLHLA